MFNLLDLKNKTINNVELWMSVFHRFKYMMRNTTNEEFYLEAIDFLSTNFNIDPNTSNSDSWRKIRYSESNGKSRFPYLLRLVEALYTLPYSTAEVERTFSSMNLLKTPLRNRLEDNTTTALVSIKESLKRKRELFESYEVDNYKKIKHFISESKESIAINLKPLENDSL